MLKRLSLIALLLVFANNAAQAMLEPIRKPPPPSVIAIVDVQRILKTSKAAKSVREQLDKQRSKFQTEIAKEEKELREAERHLYKLREQGEKKAFAEQEQKLQERFLKVERHVQSRRKALDQAFSDSMDRVRKSLVLTVSKIAKERSINLVVVKQQVIWNDQAIDITDMVLEQLNEKLPEILIKITSDRGIEAQEKSFVIKK